MTTSITTERQLKEALGLETWRNLSKDKLLNFISLLPNVDNELAIKVIEQLPEFTKMATEMVTFLKKLCNKVLDDDKHSTDQSIEAYKTIISDVYKPILDELTVIIERDDLSVDDKKTLPIRWLKSQAKPKLLPIKSAKRIPRAKISSSKFLTH